MRRALRSKLLVGVFCAMVYCRAQDAIIVVETPLGPPQPYGVVRFSPDQKRYMVAIQLEIYWYVSVDGKLEGPYNGGVSDLCFSFDSRHYAYVTDKGGGERIVVDGQPVFSGRSIELSAPGFTPRGQIHGHRLDSKGLNEFLIELDGTLKCESTHMVLTPDGKHLAYLDNSRVVLDGMKCKEYQAIVSESLAISADGLHVAYVVKTTKSDTQYLVVDNDEHDAFESVGSPLLNADGSLVAYVAGIGGAGGGLSLVVNGKASARYDACSDLRISANGKGVYCIARRRGTPIVIFDGKEHEYYQLVSDKFAVSPNGRHIAYAAVRNHKSIAVIDGKEGKEYDSIQPFFANGGIRTFAFSEDGKHWAYGAGIDHPPKRLLIIDGKEISDTPVIEYSYFHFCADGNHYLYSGKCDNGFAVVFDEKKWMETYMVSGQSISHDGGHFGFIANRAIPDAPKQSYQPFIIDGVVNGPIANAIEGTLTFSQDGKHFAYFAGIGTFKLVVDGKPLDHEYRSSQWQPPPMFLDSRRIRAFGNTKNSLVAIDVTISESK